MRNWFHKRKAEHSETAKGKPTTATNPAIQLQHAYWTHNPTEKAALLIRYPASLSWTETLRLHHLVCLELLSSKEGNPQLMGEVMQLDAPKGDTHDLCQALLQRLLSQNSPYKARHCAIWQGEAGQSGRRPPDMQGQLQNASLTHLGCLEVIRLDSQNQPKELAFIPFDDLRGVLFAQPSLFRAAKILYEDSKEEIVLAPMIYGISWLTNNEFDHDGTMTRFCCQLPIDEFDMGIGVGHQDFVLAVPKTKDKQLLGLGSIGEVMIALELNDPKFDQKCRSRGLEPSAVKQQMTGK